MSVSPSPSSSSSPTPSKPPSASAWGEYVKGDGREIPPATASVADAPSVSFTELVTALDNAIPPEGFAALRQRVIAAGCDPQDQYGYTENGGYWRGDIAAAQRVASWSNTRANAQEVIEWFEQAILLA